MTTLYHTMHVLVKKCSLYPSIFRYKIYYTPGCIIYIPHTLAWHFWCRDCQDLQLATSLYISIVMPRPPRQEVARKPTLGPPVTSIHTSYHYSEKLADKKSKQMTRGLPPYTLILGFLFHVERMPKSGLTSGLSGCW